MHFVSIISLFAIIPCLFLTVFTSITRKTKLHQLWVFLNIALVIWNVCLFLIGFSNDPEKSIVFWKIAHSFIMFVPPLFLHVVSIQCKLKKPKLIWLSYVQATFFSCIFLFTDVFINQPIYLFNSLFYFKSNTAYFIGLSSWLIFSIIPFIYLYTFINQSSGLKKVQASYLFFGALFGFVGGAVTVAPSFGILIYPFSHLGIGIYVLITSYAILKYHFLDIRVAVSRFTIFAIVYALVLGVPFYIYFALSKPFMALVFMAILATAGPFIYLFLQRKAEGRILQEENRIKELLKGAAEGMARLREAGKLEVVVDILTSSLRLKNAAVYIIDTEKFSMLDYDETIQRTDNQYILKFSKPEYEHRPVIDQNDPLVKLLIRNNWPLGYEEVKGLLEIQPNDEDLREVVKQMKELSASMIIPTIAQGNLLVGFIVLGERKTGDVFSKDLIGVLAFLGNHAALAIENAIFAEEAERSLAQRSHDARLREMGAMGSGVAHQVGNRLNIPSGLASGYLSTLKKKDLENLTREELMALLNTSEQYMEKMLKNILHCHKICIAINSYSKLSDEKEAVEIGLVIETAILIAEGRIDLKTIKLKEDYPKGVRVFGVVPMLQDIFVNLIVNARDAMQTKLSYIQCGEWECPDYNPTITITGEVRADKLIIDFSDNGTGFKPENEKSAFVPFFTTKGTGIKGKDGGTGLGLNLIWDFLRKNGGEVELINKYKKGATFRLMFPLAKLEGEPNDWKNDIVS